MEDWPEIPDFSEDNSSQLPNTIYIPYILYEAIIAFNPEFDWEMAQEGITIHVIINKDLII